MCGSILERLPREDIFSAVVKNRILGPAIGIGLSIVYSGGAIVMGRGRSCDSSF